MESPVHNNVGWTARTSSNQLQGQAPMTGERKRRGRALDVMLPTPPHSRQPTLLPTPETIRQPRKSDKSNQKYDAQVKAYTSTTSFLPTPQTLPRQRKTLNSSEPISPSGETTFIHSGTVAVDGVSERGGPRRRPGLTFAQQMGLLTTTAASGQSGFGGRLGVGVGMGGGHKTGIHRGVDLIGVKSSGGEKVEEENPFYVSPARRRKGKNAGMLDGARSIIRQPDSGDDGMDVDDDMAGPSSPLANRSPLFSTNTRYPQVDPSTPIAPSTPRLKTPANISHLPHPPAFQSQSSPSSPRRSPRQLAKAARLQAMRDEDNNPFLARPGDIHKPLKAPPGMDESDRPYVTYVFRGSKKVFANPFARPDMPFPPSELNIEDEEYEEHPCPAPRLLWPTAPIVSKSRPKAMAVTPSPPSSPIMRTPQTRQSNGGKKGRFLNADRSLGEDMFNPPKEVFSDSEDEREKYRIKKEKSDKKVRIQLADSEDEHGEELTDEEERPVQRGLLFGRSAMVSASSSNTTGSGVKRHGEDTAVGKKGKKAKTLRA